MKVHHLSIYMILTLFCIVSDIYRVNSFTSSFSVPTISSRHTVNDNNNDESTRIGSESMSASSTSLYATEKRDKNTSTSKPIQTADFEYQELKVQMDAMKKQNIKPSQLEVTKRVELEGYVKRIVNRRSQSESSIPLYQLQDALSGTKWRLAFTTESLMADTLPADADIRINFINDKRAEYSLEFSKVLGLKRLVAKSSYTVDASPVNPGLVKIEYDTISTDVFGLTDINVGFFGLLKGRSTYIPTAYYDGNIWIERGTNSNGSEFFNVYTPDN